MESKDWTVQIHITEEGDETKADAILTTQDTSRLAGRGMARRNPIDRTVPEIGDELAASRALEDLAIRLHDVASDDIVELAALRTPPESDTARPTQRRCPGRAAVTRAVGGRRRRAS